jgi:hypothetical protein
MFDVISSLSTFYYFAFGVVFTELMLKCNLELL